MENIDSPNVEVRNVGGKGVGIFATTPFKKDDLVIIAKPVKYLTTGTVTSVQLSASQHAELSPPVCYTNHSCTPNIWAEANSHGGYNFIAMRDIAKDEEITFDYETTEYEMVAPIDCQCGSEQCRQEIRGYKFLDDDMKQFYQDMTAKYLLEEYQPAS